MTIEEAIQKAENDDVGAMIALGDFYFQEEKDNEQAVKWYEMAAKHKVVYAIHMTVLLKLISAQAAMLIAKQVEYGVQFAMEDWKSVYEWLAEELECINNNVPGSESLKIEDSIEKFKEASYNYALCCYFLGDYATASALISDFDNTPSIILYGSCLIQLGENGKDMANAIKTLTPVICDREYVAASKSALEEDAYRIAGIMLSRLHRIAGNMEPAVELLTFMSNAVRRDNNKQAISDELSHYQKKLFGGYKYV